MKANQLKIKEKQKRVKELSDIKAGRI